MLYAEKIAAALVFLAATMSAALGATTYSYDALGRLATVTYDNGKQVIYSYDPAGNRTQVVTQTAVNQPPVAVNDSISTTINTAKNFDPRTNDSDPDGDTLTITAKTNGTNGTVVINSGTSLTYTPTTNYTGSDSFTYTISDGNGHTAIATVSVTVSSGVNQPPTAVNDSISTAVNTAKTFDPRVNDSDPDGDALTITVKTDGTHGTVVINGGGVSLTYTPATNYTGSDSFTYTISDGNGHTASATVSVTVTAANQAPTAVNDSISTLVNTAKTFDPRVNDSDPDGDPLTISAKTNGAHGTVVINGGGVSLTYTPTTNYTGSDSFTYTISDGQGHTATATVSVTVTSSNQPPVAVNDSVSIIKFTNGTCITPTKTFDPRTNDSDPDGDPLTITATVGSATINSGVSVTYTYPGCVLNLIDTDTFTYTISDGQGHTATATVTVNIDVEAGGTLASPPVDEGG